jgi:hypothetical protein
MIYVGDEPLGHLGQQSRRSIGEPAVANEEARRLGCVLQPRLVQVEVHPVDRLDLECNVAGQDIGNGAR